MATIVEIHPSVGSVWMRGLQLWDGYATGAFTSWAAARHTGMDDKAYDITVGTSGGGSDTYTLIMLDIQGGSFVPLTYLCAVPGFGTTLKDAYPNTLPDGAAMPNAYRDSAWLWRQDIFNYVAGVTPDLQDGDDTGTRYGVQVRFYRCNYFHNLLVVSDASGVMHGTPEFDTSYGMPANCIGTTNPSVISSSGGGGGDPSVLIPVLQDIALKDVSYSFNNGATIFNCRGKVNS